MTKRDCDCAACRDRAARDFWRIVNASYAASDELAADERARAEWENVLAGAVRGEGEDGA